MKTIAEVMVYINRHNQLFGYPPTCVGLPYEEYCKVLREMDRDGRCTNIKARILDVPLVNLSL